MPAQTVDARLDSNPIVHRLVEALLAAQVFLGRLYGNMPQEELDLLQLASCAVTEASTGTPQIVRREQLRAIDIPLNAVGRDGKHRR